MTKQATKPDNNTVPAATSELTPEMAQRFLQEQDLVRRRECLAEIQKILDKYGYRYEVAVIVTATGNIPQLSLVAK